MMCLFVDLSPCRGIRAEHSTQPASPNKSHCAAGLALCPRQWSKCRVPYSR